MNALKKKVKEKESSQKKRKRKKKARILIKSGCQNGPIQQDFNVSCEWDGYTYKGIFERQITGDIYNVQRCSFYFSECQLDFFMANIQDDEGKPQT